MERRIRRLGLAFVLLFSLLFAQVAYVQVIAADRIANQQGNAARQIRAEYQTERGRILAADGRTVLAESVEAPAGSVYAFERAYPKADVYGHITGYYSRLFGRSGLEQAMNPYLSGDADELVAANLTDLILGKPKKGGTVITTIVPRIQLAARRALGSRRGAVVAINPRTGDVLAVWSNPSFDPTPLSVGTGVDMTAAWEALNADPEKPLLSKAFEELYLPGSTGKLVTATAALQNGYGPQQTWPNPRILDLPTTRDDLENFGGSLCNGGSAKVTMAQAFQQSCNVTFGEIGLELGADRLTQMARDWGFCPTLPPERVDCDGDTIPFALGVENGHYPEASYFAERIPAIAYSAVGLDNVLTNPLHLGLITAAIANGGTLYEPRIVTEIRDAQGQVVKEFAPRAYGHPISSGTAATMQAMMLSVTQGGTASSTFSGFGVDVAGKTGTATNGEGRAPNAWFTAFAPAGATDTPTIAVTVIVLDGGDLGSEATGGREAAPIAREVIAAALGL
ncbi:MAG: penicillin-binding transpeptidase domain-containing protein [Actinomycetota bacterium]